MLDDEVRFVKGWFSETSLAPGGFLIIDDYGAMAPCRQAVEDYRARHSVSEEVRQIDWSGVFWRKEQDVKVAASQRTRNLASDARG